jgi:hypothetical protein
MIASLQIDESPDEIRRTTNFIDNVITSPLVCYGLSSKMDSREGGNPFLWQI